MNAMDLRKLKEWRENGGLTAEEVESGGRRMIGSGLSALVIHLWEMETNMAMALYDFMAVLGVGQADIEEVLGSENMESINGLLAEEIIPTDEATMAYRVAKVLFEPEEPLEDYGFIPTVVSLPDAVWNAMEETIDDRFVFLGPVILDQNTRTVYMAKGVTLEALAPGTKLLGEQVVAASRAMKEVQDATLNN